MAFLDAFFEEPHFMEFLVCIILNLIFLLYKVTSNSSYKTDGRPEKRVRDIIDSESDEEMKRFLMEETTAPSTPTTRPRKKDLRKLFKSAFSVIRFKNKLKFINEKNSLYEFKFPFDEKKVFEGFDTLDFNIFDLKEHPLLYVGMYFLMKHGLMKKFKLPSHKMEKLLKSAEAKYNDVPYHNRYHAADCIQTSHALMRMTKSFRVLSKLDMLALFFGTLSHDLEHPGYSNRFLIVSDHNYAVEHNDQSPLENHHCRCLFSLIKESGIRIHFTTEEFRNIRENVIDMILGTDGAKFMQYEQVIKKLLFMQGSGRPDPKGCLILLMKCSDISNPIKRPEIYLEWTRRVMTEFFLQGDEESRRNFNVSAFMNRDTTSISKCQMGFIKYLVLPVYTLLSEFDRGYENIVKDLEAKMGFWGEKEEMDKKKKYTPEEILELEKEFGRYLDDVRV